MAHVKAVCHDAVGVIAKIQQNYENPCINVKKYNKRVSLAS